MTAPAASLQTSRRLWAVWTTLLAMLLAIQVSAGAIRPVALVESGAVATKLTLPAPLAAQFRDTGQALKAAGQRFNTARPLDGHDGSTPPLPTFTIAIAAPVPAADPHDASLGITPHGAGTSGANRARAPPLV